MLVEKYESLKHVGGSHLITPDGIMNGDGTILET